MSKGSSTDLPFLQGNLQLSRGLSHAWQIEPSRELTKQLFKRMQVVNLFLSSQIA